MAVFMCRGEKDQARVNLHDPLFPITGYYYQSIQSYDFSGWNSGTAGLLLSYWNAT